jgi:hypothetical protein
MLPQIEINYTSTGNLYHAALKVKIPSSNGRSLDPLWTAPNLQIFDKLLTEYWGTSSNGDYRYKTMVYSGSSFEAQKLQAETCKKAILATFSEILAQKVPDPLTQTWENVGPTNLHASITVIFAKQHRALAVLKLNKKPAQGFLDNWLEVPSCGGYEYEANLKESSNSGITLAVEQLLADVRCQLESYTAEVIDCDLCHVLTNSNTVQ